MTARILATTNRKGGVGKTHGKRRDLLNTQILATMQAWHEATGFYPTMRELARHLNASTSVMSAHLRHLRARGYVAFEDGAVGTLRLCKSLTVVSHDECVQAADAAGHVPAWEVA